MNQARKNGKLPADVPDDSSRPHDEIGARLRAMYAEVENEAIPAELIDLLEKLDDAEKRERR